MEGMDPNNPPPKETRVELRQWEYTDPIGKPHPNVIEVAVQIRNDSGREVDAIIPEVEIQWLEGALSKKASADWGEKIPLPKPTPFSLISGRSKTTRIPVDVAAEMATLAPVHRWPWSLRALITTRAAGIVVGSTLLELPIIPGD
jgi:hypothetical protein